MGQFFLLINPPPPPPQNSGNPILGIKFPCHLILYDDIDGKNIINWVTNNLMPN
jgi:hypothetical protein